MGLAEQLFGQILVAASSLIFGGYRYCGDTVETILEGVDGGRS